MATKYENYASGQDNIFQIGSTTWCAQTFTPSANHTVKAVRIKICRFGSPGTVTASIRATTAGVPSGADLVSGTIDGNALPNGVGSSDDINTAVWKWFDLGAGVALVASTVYAIIVKAPSGGAYTNCLEWVLDSAGAYSGGRLYASSDSGSTWTLNQAAYAPYDFYFEEWDAVYTVPSDSMARVSSIRHIYKPGVFRMIVSVGDIDSEIPITRLATITSGALNKPPVPIVRTFEEIDEEIKRAAAVAERTRAAAIGGQGGVFPSGQPESYPAGVRYVGGGYTPGVGPRMTPAQEAQARQYEPGAPTARTIEILRTRTQEVQAIEQRIAQQKMAAGGPMPISERTASILRTSPEAYAMMETKRTQAEQQENPLQKLGRSIRNLWKMW